MYEGWGCWGVGLVVGNDGVIGDGVVWVGLYGWVMVWVVD